MTIKFNKSEKFNEAKQKLTAAMSNPEATEKEQTEAFENYFSALQGEVTDAVSKQVNAEMFDRSILQNRGQNVLTNEERRFFQNVIDKKGFDDDSILPVTTQERIFEDIVAEHPLLDALGLRDLGAVTRFIYSDAEKNFVWGELFGPIQGQIGASFREETVTQLKLTAYAVVPNDMLELGPEWIERYVRTVAVETISVGLEYGFVNGNGQSQPIGLLKNKDSGTGAITDKTSSGTLTFAPSERGEVVAGELYNVINALSTDAAGKRRKVNGRVVMVVNPQDALAVQFRNTIQTANGQWVTALPYNVRVVESEEIPAGKAVFFVQGDYLAIIAGGYRLKKFTETLAMEDATLYTIKQFANGKPKDNKAALVYDLDISFDTVPTP